MSGTKPDTLRGECTCSVTVLNSTSPFGKAQEVFVPMGPATAEDESASPSGQVREVAYLFVNV